MKTRTVFKVLANAAFVATEAVIVAHGWQKYRKAVNRDIPFAIYRTKKASKKDNGRSDSHA